MQEGKVSDDVLALRSKCIIGRGLGTGKFHRKRWPVYGKSLSLHSWDAVAASTREGARCGSKKGGVSIPCGVAEISLPGFTSWCSPWRGCQVWVQVRTLGERDEGR